MSQLRMVWKNKEPLPAKLKEGCYVVDSTTDRFTKEELADGWTDACTELCRGRWSREQFFEKHWNDPKIPKGGIFFAVTPENRIFSTATVRVQDGHVGDLHMVGTAGDCKGMGGGHAVCLEVVRYFQKHEIKLAYLFTDEFRIPAIKIYLKLGFVPYLYESDMAERWQGVMKDMGIAELDACDGELRDMKLFSFETK